MNLANSPDQDDVLTITEELLNIFGSSEEINHVEAYLIDEKNEVPLRVHLATKLAKSRMIVEAISRPVHVSLIFAVYKEHNRIRSRDEHEHGEDFLTQKIAQLQWLFDKSPNFTWDLTLVDDGDPNEAGKIAQSILQDRFDGDNVEVLFLEEAIRNKFEVTRPMRSADESQKGGAVAYGLWHVVQQQHLNHIVIFTDADLSTHVGQAGLLINGIINQGKAASIGSRREKASIVVKEGSRNDRGKQFINLWKRMLPQLNHIIDTQCGFKGFRADIVRLIVNDLIEKRFAFDIELLLRTELIEQGSIVNIPIAWIDSVAASTTTDLRPYLSMLKSIAQMYHKYLAEEDEAQAFAEFVEELDEDQWNKLLNHIPQQILNREPAEFGTYNGVTVSALQEIVFG